MRGMRELYFNRRVGMMLPLGFASGLPLALTGDTLLAWAREAGVSLTGIGVLSLVSLPYTLKFLWAPFVDRYAAPLLDRRRSWMLLAQLALMLAIALMAWSDPVTSPVRLSCMAVLVAFLSATQDIAVDAYRTDILSDTQRGSGSAIFVGGYRLGMIASGGFALILADSGLTWPMVYSLMSLGMIVGTLATLFAERTPADIPAPPTLQEAVVAPLRQLLTRESGLLVIFFVILFKLPDVAAGGLTTPFLLDIGISKNDIGWIRQTLGLFITIVGALAGGALVGALGLKRSLWIFGILQAASNVGFLLLAQFPKSYPMLVGVLGTESFCGGLVTAGFSAFLMSQCDRRYSAFQFALLSSAMAITRIIGVAPGGWLADHTGWPLFFLITIVAAIPSLIMLPFLPNGPTDADNRT